MKNRKMIKKEKWCKIFRVEIGKAINRASFDSQLIIIEILLIMLVIRRREEKIFEESKHFD